MTLQFVPSSEHDFAELVELRIEAMRESLERVGRFDRERSIDRFRSSFVASETTKILCRHQLVGFYSYSIQPDHIFLAHLYVMPSWQSKGLGALAMERMIEHSESIGLPIRLGALKESRSNNFF